MILEEYSTSRANKLSKIAVPDLKEPFEMKFLWLQNEDFNNRSVNFNNKLHKHTFYEIHFILEGENIIKDKNGKQFILKPNEAIILAPNSQHLSNDFTGDLKRFSIAFSVSEDTMVNKVLNSLNFYVYMLSKKMLDNLNKIYAECDKCTLLSVYIIRNRIFEIIEEFLALKKYNENFSDNTFFPHNLIISNVKKYINDNLDLVFTCKDVSDYCKYNEIYLNRIFKKNTGETLLKYIHRKKTEYAQTLLKNNNLTISEISSLLGFKNVYYFNTFFKREAGVAPGVYKETSSNKH